MGNESLGYQIDLLPRPPFGLSYLRAHEAPDPNPGASSYESSLWWASRRALPVLPSWPVVQFPAKALKPRQRPSAGFSTWVEEWY